MSMSVCPECKGEMTLFAKRTGTRAPREVYHCPECKEFWYREFRFTNSKWSGWSGLQKIERGSKFFLSSTDEMG